MTGPQEANLCVPVFLSLLLLMLARRPGPRLLCPCLNIFSLQVSLPLCIPFHAVCIPVYVSALCLTRCVLIIVVVVSAFLVPLVCYRSSFSSLSHVHMHTHKHSLHVHDVSVCVCLWRPHHRLRRSLSIHVSVAHRRLRRRHDTHVFA